MKSVNTKFRHYCHFTCTDVFPFPGRKPDPRSREEAVSDYKDRPPGCRVKIGMKAGSIKMYDRSRVLHIEATIIDPREFSFFGPVRHRDGTESNEWKPKEKSIADPYRYAETSKACITSCLGAMGAIVPEKSRLKKIEEICSGKKTGGRKVTGKNVWSKEAVLIMETVLDGRYLVHGFNTRIYDAKSFRT